MNIHKMGCAGGNKPPLGPKMKPKYPTPPSYQTPQPPISNAQMPSTPPAASLNVFTPDEGFVKGTMFKGVYRPYKNYQPRLVWPTDNERAAMMFDIDKYYFAAHEVRLYLDNNPNDQEAINLFNQYVDGYGRAKKAYEERYGALSLESDALTTAPFNWTVGEWPWVGGL